MWRVLVSLFLCFSCPFAHNKQNKLPLRCRVCASPATSVCEQYAIGPFRRPQLQQTHFLGILAGSFEHSWHMSDVTTRPAALEYMQYRPLYSIQLARRCCFNNSMWQFSMADRENELTCTAYDIRTRNRSLPYPWLLLSSISRWPHKS